MDKWQPIDTAPQTSPSERILVTDGCNCFVAWLSEDKYQGWIYGVDGSSGVNYAQECCPSHWLPLPEPPK